MGRPVTKKDALSGVVAVGVIKEFFQNISK